MMFNLIKSWKVVSAIILFSSLILFFFITNITLNDNESNGVLCVKNNHGVARPKVIYIDKAACVGFLFPNAEFINYFSSNNGLGGKLEITVNPEHKNWLRGSVIKMVEHEFNVAYQKHYRNQISGDYSEQNTYFDQYLGLMVYIQENDVTSSYYIKAANPDGEFPFYISCLVVPGRSKEDSPCRVWFPFEEVISVDAKVHYRDLDEAKNKVSEIHNFINNLIDFNDSAEFKDR